MMNADFRPRSRPLTPLFLGVLLAAGCQFLFPQKGGTPGTSGSSDAGTPATGSPTGCGIDLNHEAVIAVTGTVKSLPQTLNTDDPMEVNFEPYANIYTPGFGPPNWISIQTKTIEAGSNPKDPFRALHLVVGTPPAPKASAGGSTPLATGMVYGFGMGPTVDTGQFVLEATTANADDSDTVTCPHGWLGSFKVEDMTMTGNADAGFVLSGMAVSYQATCVTGGTVAGCASWK